MAMRSSIVEARDATQQSVGRVCACPVMEARDVSVGRVCACPAVDAHSAMSRHVRNNLRRREFSHLFNSRIPILRIYTQ